MAENRPAGTWQTKGRYLVEKKEGNAGKLIMMASANRFTCFFFYGYPTIVLELWL
jgi:hypothetical protein